MTKPQYFGPLSGDDTYDVKRGVIVQTFSNDAVPIEDIDLRMFNPLGDPIERTPFNLTSAAIAAALEVLDLNGRDALANIITALVCRLADTRD